MNINYFNDIYFIDIVTQGQVILCIRKNVFPVIQDFINMFYRIIKLGGIR